MLPDTAVVIDKDCIRPQQLQLPWPDLDVNRPVGDLGQWISTCRPLYRVERANERVTVDYECSELSAVVFVACHMILLLLLHPFNGLFSRTSWVSRNQKGKSFWILLEQEMMGWLLHQLDQYLTTQFLQAGCPPAAQPTMSKHLRHAI